MDAKGENGQGAPRTVSDWITALREFAAHIMDGRRAHSVVTRLQIGEALRELAKGRDYSAPNVVLRSDRQALYVTVQAVAAPHLMARLERAGSSAVRTIKLRPIPGQRLMEISIELYPRPAD